MLLSTTSTLEGKTIVEYRGIVFGEVINGVNFLKDFGASFSNMFGGRAVEYEEELIDTRAQAITEMISRAERVGANAVVGVKVDFETIGEAGSMLMAVASGTAVVVK